MVFVFLAACELLCAKDDPAMKKRAEDGWMVEDYAALEKIAAECRADRMDILDAFPRLTYFYTGFGERACSPTRLPQSGFAVWKAGRSNFLNP
jgi:hypothetical protein